MSDWRPASGPQAAASRAAMTRRVRDYFLAQNVLEVDTPALSAAAVSDLQIESLTIADSSIAKQPLYLHTSPEFFMKRLLASGYPDIYSICRVFRDGEAGRNHQPEFTMIEWYRLGMTLDAIIEDTVALIGAALGDEAPPQQPVILDYVETLSELCGGETSKLSAAALADALDADDDLRTAMGDALDDWLDLALAAKVIPNFAADRLTILRHYPASQAALARLCPDNLNVADRFEVFLGPIELANGYVELTDAKELEARFVRDNENRASRGRPVRPVDENLLAALAAGFPECAGVAMGLERLQMQYDKTDDIDDVISFSRDYE